jgi:hypothetical protein
MMKPIPVGMPYIGESELINAEQVRQDIIAG